MKLEFLIFNSESINAAKFRSYGIVVDSSIYGNNLSLNQFLIISYLSALANAIKKIPEDLRENIKVHFFLENKFDGIYNYYKDSCKSNNITLHIVTKESESLFCFNCSTDFFPIIFFDQEKEDTFLNGSIFDGISIHHGDYRLAGG